MPKGKYSRRIAEDEWHPEHDDELRRVMETGASFGQAAVILNRKFPGMNWSRNAVLGRAKRKGIKSQNPHAGTGRPRANKPVNLSARKRRALVKNTQAPVVFKQADEPILRHEGDRGVANSPKGTRHRAYNDPVVIERKKGMLPAIVEEKPLTTVSVALCEKGSCMWPTSDDLKCLEVCGEPVEIGAYCKRHADVAYRVMPTKRRNDRHAKEDREHERRIDGSQHRDALDPDGAWLARRILEVMDEVEVVGEDDGLASLSIPFFLEKLA